MQLQMLLRQAFLTRISCNSHCPFPYPATFVFLHSLSSPRSLSRDLATCKGAFRGPGYRARRHTCTFVYVTHVCRDLRAREQERRKPESARGRGKGRSRVLRTPRNERNESMTRAKEGEVRNCWGWAVTVRLLLAKESASLIMYLRASPPPFISSTLLLPSSSTRLPTFSHTSNHPSFFLLCLRHRHIATDIARRRRRR